MNEERLLALTTRIYDAALDQAQWLPVLREIRDLTDSQGATFCVIDSADRTELPIFINDGFDPCMIGEYLDGMADYDPTVQHIVANPRQKIVHDSAIISEAEKDRHPYYNWHARYSDTRHRIAAMISPAPHIQSGITIHRSRKKVDYGPATKRRLRHIVGHLERAVEIGFRLGVLNGVKDGLLDLIDANPSAIALLDRDGRITMVNRSLRWLVESDDGVALDGAELVLKRTADDRRLRRLIAQALAVTEHPIAPPGGLIQALRPSGKRPYTILVSPLCARMAAIGKSEPACCVVITDPDHEPQNRAAQLQALFKLTPAEARLAEQLMGGADLRAAAAAGGVRYSTARSYLAAVFRKTGTGRQSELVAMLLSSLPPYDLPGHGVPSI